ncbi:hypothetical protein BX661DRAFT_177747 [Kickxella alabastrina]|uniref:uncharacterized protein n=1 Tax=Kickxella alabastrina TaxID=61397 RepID=UPI00221F50F2|nr:uncharacterized protein BX661DRAFT_177747 [Kickxella alabastrina]KAI7833895.1 hypothetical protein BX661DRAFT_177747 [Kickxella alabastrina]
MLPAQTTLPICCSIMTSTCSNTTVLNRPSSSSTVELSWACATISCRISHCMAISSTSSDAAPCSLKLSEFNANCAKELTISGIRMSNAASMSAPPFGIIGPGISGVSLSLCLSVWVTEI